MQTFVGEETLEYARSRPGAWPGLAVRYWAPQRTETAIYLALAAALAGLCFRRLTRRVARKSQSAAEPLITWFQGGSQMGKRPVPSLVVIHWISVKAFI